MKNVTRKSDLIGGNGFLHPGGVYRTAQFVFSFQIKSIKQILEEEC